MFKINNLNKIFIKGSVDMFINLTLCDEQMTMIKSIAIVQYLVKSDRTITFKAVPLNQCYNLIANYVKLFSATAFKYSTNFVLFFIIC